MNRSRATVTLEAAEANLAASREVALTQAVRVGANEGWETKDERGLSGGAAGAVGARVAAAGRTEVWQAVHRR